MKKLLIIFILILIMGCSEVQQPANTVLVEITTKQTVFGDYTIYGYANKEIISKYINGDYNGNIELLEKNNQNGYATKNIVNTRDIKALIISN